MLCSRIEVVRYGNAAPGDFLRNICMQTASNRIWMAVKSILQRSRETNSSFEKEKVKITPQWLRIPQQMFVSIRINAFFNST